MYATPQTEVGLLILTAGVSGRLASRVGAELPQVKPKFVSTCQVKNVLTMEGLQ